MEQKPRITKIVPPKYTEELPETNNLNDAQRQAARNAAYDIEKAFKWAETVEGSDFWQSVHDRLRAIAKGEPLK